MNDPVEPPLRLDDFLPYRLAVLASALSSSLSRLLLLHRLTMSELFVLMALGQSGRVTAKTLGDKALMHKTKISRIVASLLARGLISRELNPADRRETHLHLTPIGRETYQDCLRLASPFARGLQYSIPPADWASLDRGLRKLGDRAAALIHGGARRAVSP